jgi:hypothetical protein
VEASHTDFERRAIEMLFDRIVAEVQSVSVSLPASRMILRRELQEAIRTIERKNYVEIRGRFFPWDDQALFQVSLTLSRGEMRTLMTDALSSLNS